MSQRELDILKDFLRFCKKELGIQSLPNIKIITDPQFVYDNRSFGGYFPHDNTIKLYCKGRVMADYMRSLAHELTHHRQMELNLLQADSGETGSEVENEANAMAGILLREYGQLNSDIYELDYAQPLEEARQVGTLYYFGPYRRLARLVASDFKLTSTIQPFVSFTRNKRMVSDTIANEVRITLDGDKLSQRYKIAPFAHTSAGYGRSSADEAEERIDLKKHPQGVDISKAILTVDIKDPMSVNTAFDDEESFEPPSLEEYHRLLKILKAKNIDFNIVKEFK